MHVDGNPDHWNIFDEIDSTNTLLMRERFPSGSVVIAHHQTQGRGRRDRRWYDRPGDTLLFSAYLELGSEEIRSWNLSYLPLLSGAAVLQACHDALFARENVTETENMQLLIKWPNDVLLNRNGEIGKVAGILVESEIRGQDNMRIVIGIGVNWRGERISIADGNFPPVSLFPSGHEQTSLNLAPHLVKRLNQWLEDPQGTKVNLAGFLDERCYLKGKLLRRKDALYRVIGLTDEGALRIHSVESNEEITLYDVDWEEVMEEL